MKINIYINQLFIGEYAVLSKKSLYYSLRFLVPFIPSWLGRNKLNKKYIVKVLDKVWIYIKYLL